MRLDSLLNHTLYSSHYFVIHLLMGVKDFWHLGEWTWKNLDQNLSSSKSSSLNRFLWFLVSLITILLVFFKFLFSVFTLLFCALTLTPPYIYIYFFLIPKFCSTCVYTFDILLSLFSENNGCWVLIMLSYRTRKANNRF